MAKRKPTPKQLLSQMHAIGITDEYYGYPRAMCPCCGTSYLKGEVRPVHCPYCEGDSENAIKYATAAEELFKQWISRVQGGDLSDELLAEIEFAYAHFGGYYAFEAGHRLRALKRLRGES